MTTCTEHIIALIFKLLIFGVDIDGPAIMLNDNESAMHNISNIESTLNKKHSSFSYHLVGQNVPAGVVNIGWILKADNISDSLLKRLTEAKREKLFGDGLIEVANCIEDQGDQMNTAVMRQLGVQHL